ncbi:hypothetical protein C0Q88_07770 [Ralstonia pickettii]|uniref:Phage minor tail protein L n=1 Tax=Ralstonia pickettii TaxID=329 RepID=A0A2N4TY06_RALPI|nr:hypothetical protein [Ralstonia pickettii]PLC44568.1 hypothetical protein C0Q88_07770 [Ralstonia pickettii]
MSKSLSIATVLEKNKLSSDTPFLVCLDIAVADPATGAQVEMLHIVRNTEAITFNGQVYEPTAFDVELKAESGQQPTVNLTIKDYSKAIQGRLQSYGGGIGFGVTLFVVNAGALDQPPEVVEYFEVVGAQCANYEVSFVLGADSLMAVVFPRRRQTRDFCQWRYKDPNTCGYTGAAPTCDLTLYGQNGCAAHGNVINFGGFPGINQNGVRYG